jgi:hypothetical protein
MNRDERASKQMDQGPIQNVRRVIELEDTIDEVLAMNDVEVERMRASLAATLQTGLRVRVQLQLTSEQRRELLIQGDPEAVIQDKLRNLDDAQFKRAWKAGEIRVVTDHTGQTFDLPS